MAWPAAKIGSQQSAAASPDDSTSDPDPADQVTNHARNTPPALLAQSDSNLPGGRRYRQKWRGYPSGQTANSSGGSPAVSVSMPTDIMHVNERQNLGSEPITDARTRTRPSRDRRRPARYLTRVTASDAAVVPITTCRHIETCVKVNKSAQSCEELLRNLNNNCSRTSSVVSDCRKMPDKRSRKGKRRHRSSSSDSDTDCQNGHCRPRQRQPRVPFEPHFCGQCVLPDRRTRYATRSSLTKHTVLQHGSWYHPGRDEYVPIPEDRLTAMRERYQAWQSHRNKSAK